jgi:26-hydroxylase
MIVWGVQRLATWFLHLMVDTTCSESLWHTLAVTALVYLSVCTWRWWRASMRLPPGPRGLPFVGYLPYIQRDFHEELTFLSKKHAASTGGVFSVRLGSQLNVVLSDHRVIREAFRREEFACRPDNDFMKLLDGYGTSNFLLLLILFNLILI